MLFFSIPIVESQVMLFCIEVIIFRWKQMRAKLSSTLTVGKLKEIFPVMKDIIPRLDSYLEKQSGMDIEVRLDTLMCRHTKMNSKEANNQNKQIQTSFV